MARDQLYPRPAQLSTVHTQPRSQALEIMAPWPVTISPDEDV